MAILKDGLKTIAAFLYDTWGRKSWTEKNLPPGWILQGKLQQGMSSLSLLPENEELATASCGSNLYPKNVTVINKFYLQNNPLQINMTLIHHV